MMPFSSLLPDILPLAAGCPSALAMAALRRATDEFCTRTLAWRADLPAVDLLAEYPFYRLDAPLGSRIVMVLEAFVQGRRLIAASEESLDDEHPGWAMLGPGTPSRFVLPRAGELRLVPAPATYAKAGLLVQAALAPAAGAPETEDFLIRDHGQALVHGALSRLLAMPAKSWTDQSLATHHGRQFRAALADTRAGELKGRTRRSLTAKAQVFG
ncbi:MAG: hypothetical protein R6W92_17475 [Desulfocurvibacter africanus]